MQKKSKDSVLVTLADKKYLNQAKQLFSSVYLNSGWDGDYLLLVHDIPASELKWFSDKGILIYKCKPLSDKKLYGQISSCTLDKFYLFTPYFKRWKTIVYLDADIIVRYSLDELKCETSFGAVKDGIPLLYNFRKDFNKSKLYDSLSKSYNLNSEGFNSGVMVINSDIIDEKTFKELSDMIAVFKNDAMLGEQPILNLYFYEKWNHLPITYNLNIFHLKNTLGIDVSKMDGTIVHTTGPEKAWKKGSEFFNEWNDNLLSSEKIDLDNRPVAKYLSDDKVSYYSEQINRRQELFYKLYLKMKIFVSPKVLDFILSFRR